MINHVTYAIINSSNLSLVFRNTSKENDFKHKIEEKVNPIEPVGNIGSIDKRNSKADAYIAYNLLKNKVKR